ncbi:MAG: solute carrier family 23 protein, partial [Myxococcota bacterium]
GLVAVVVGVLFLLSLFLAPLATSIPPYATAPALLLVACMMARGLAEIYWDDVTEYVPAVLTALLMPLTYSIANGIGAGFIAYAAIKLLSGKFRDLNPAIVIIAILAAIKFAFYG